MNSLSCVFDCEESENKTGDWIEKHRIVATSISRNGLYHCMHSAFSENFCFNIQCLNPDIDVTNQQKTGRCWVFAGMNILRRYIISHYNLETFELSYSHFMFYEKMERAAYVLDCAMRWDTEYVHLGDRGINELTGQKCMQDGGQWQMFVNIVTKYGILPRSAMPETFDSNSTRYLNSTLRKIVRRGFYTILESTNHVSKGDALQSAMNDVYRVLSLAIGIPPKDFILCVSDKRGTVISEKMNTMQLFEIANSKYPVQNNVVLADIAGLVNDTNVTCSVELSGNMMGGEISKYITCNSETLAQCVLTSLKNGHPVWLGVNFGEMRGEKNQHCLAVNCDYRGLCRSIPFSKRDTVKFNDAQINHAVLVIGAHVEEGKIIRWKIENSHGKDGSYKGRILMSHDWFLQFAFTASLPSCFHDVTKLSRVEVLSPWCILGNLATTV